MSAFVGVTLAKVVVSGHFLQRNHSGQIEN